MKDAMILLIFCLIAFGLTVGSIYSIFSVLENNDLESEVLENENFEADVELIAKVVWLEAGGESEECQDAIISVIMNMKDAGYWGETYKEVLYYKNAFSVVPRLSESQPTEETKELVRKRLKTGSGLPEYVRYFRADYPHPWDGYETYMVIDNVYFGYFKDYKSGIH